MRFLIYSLILITSLILNACGGSGTNTSKNQPNQPQKHPLQTNAKQPKSPIKPIPFTLAVLPDTQYYTQKYPAIFNAQTNWIANNYKTENIKFTMHLGDIVETQNSDKEWQNARTAMHYLDKNPATPYSILAGNHDTFGLGLAEYFNLDYIEYDTNRDLKKERFLAYFSPKQQRQHFRTFKGADATGLNSYHIFSDDNQQQYLVFALYWKNSDTTLAWVQSILDQHANLPAILTTHELLDPRGTDPLPKWTKNGKRLWNKLIADNDQIFLTINGHWQGMGYRLEKNNYGREVLMIAVDYQKDHKGGNGMLQLITLDTIKNRFSIRSLSPYVASLKAQQKTTQDQLEKDQFDVAMNFAQRLHHFNKRP